MPLRARLYISIVLAVAGVILAASLLRPEISDPYRLSGYLALAFVASTFKVRIPGLTGNYSLNFLVLLAALQELHLTELVAIAIVCAITQSYWRASRRVQLIQVAFNGSNLVVSIAGAAEVFHKFRFWPANWVVLSGALAAVAYYLLNTGLTSIVLSLVEAGGFKRVWAHWSLYILPYYLLGSTLSTAWLFCNRQVGVQGVIVSALVFFWMWRLLRASVSSPAGLARSPVL